MIISLALFGVLTGFLSGFFGIGGGTVLVPLLLYIGFDMKQAIAISVMQMVFSSIFGSFLNFKNNKNILNDAIYIGLGGFVGGLFSGIIVTFVSSLYLKYLFIASIVFSIIRIYTSLPHNNSKLTQHSKVKLIIIGFFIGMIAMSIGIGGATLLTPILVGYMFYNLKDAASLGLFFVIFSSIAGFISLSFSGHMLFFEGFIVGSLSLIGVYFGIITKNIIKSHSYKKIILIMYISILTYVSYSTFF